MIIHQAEFAKMNLLNMESMTNLNMKIITGEEISENDIESFNAAWRVAFEKDKDPLGRSTIGKRDINFFLYDENVLVAIGRYRFISGIKLGEKDYAGEVWGIADIGVCGEKGLGYGKEIVNRMSNYAFENNMLSCIGFHGKKTTLSEFYRKCGMIVNEEIGERICKYVNRDLVSMAHTNVLYFENDPFIKAVLECNDPVVIPFSW